MPSSERSRTAGESRRGPGDRWQRCGEHEEFQLFELCVRPETPSQ